MASGSNQSPDQQIVAWEVFNGLQPAELGEVRLSGDDRRTQGELYAVQLPSDQNSSIEVRDHADGMKVFGKGLIFHRHVEAGRYSHVRILKGATTVRK